MVAQWIAGAIIFVLVVVVVWAMAKPHQERTKIVTGYFGILGVLLGAGLQEFRVQDQQQAASAARSEVVEAKSQADAARRDAQVAQREALAWFTRLQTADRLVTEARVQGTNVVLSQADVQELKRLAREEQPTIFRDVQP